MYRAALLNDNKAEKKRNSLLFPARDGVWVKKIDKPTGLLEKTPTEVHY